MKASSSPKGRRIVLRTSYA